MTGNAKFCKNCGNPMATVPSAQERKENPVKSVVVSENSGAPSLLRALGMAFVYISGAFVVAGSFISSTSYGDGSTLTGWGVVGLVIAFIVFFVQLVKKYR